MNQPRVVVVTFDAASKTFALNPDPIALLPGETTLYFALQTTNRGEAPRAVLLDIVEDATIREASKVEGCDQLWSTKITNDLIAGRAEESHSYSLVVHYAGHPYPYDPTVILQPPPIGGG